MSDNIDRDQYLVKTEPYYRPVAQEVALYEAAYGVRMPVLLKGPTGCGKSRFVEYMAWRLGRPLITVACNEDMTASDLVGRFLLDVNGTRWQDGPLTVAARIDLVVASAGSGDEDGADADLVTLAHVLQRFDDIYWDTAKKERLSNGAIAWRFPLTLLSTIEE